MVAVQAGSPSHLARKGAKVSIMHGGTPRGASLVLLLLPAARAQVCDRVRELLLCEESENAELYSDDEKGELLWRIFGHLVLGGACNQYEVSCACTWGQAERWQQG